MPLRYRFFTADGLTAVKANKVDEDICLYLGKNPSDKDYSQEFLTMIEMAYESLDHNNEFNFNIFMRVCVGRSNTWMIGYFYKLLQLKYKLIIYRDD